MRYYSTNGAASEVTLKEAIIKGLAPDKGLYMPESIKTLPAAFFKNIGGLSLQEIAYAVADSLFGEDVDADVLKRIVYDALNFDIPLHKVADRRYCLELYHGPTLAFKDVGARFMARMLGYFNAQDSDKRPVNVLVATSGDTGSAVANGFLGVDGVHVYVLYPKGKVSHIQESQFTTLGRNITAVEVDETFDDCQALVKKAFMDEQLNAHMKLTSANSINIARFLPQMFYYFYAYAQLAAAGKEDLSQIVVAVPSGNFGNLTAGLIAKRMGLPIKRGIKFHAALDTVIANNNIHDCSLGMWMDWQTQGTRITRNVFHDNVRDLMIEVSHGPYLVDNNVFASPVMFQNWSQGGAFVNNLICGGIEPHTVPDRSTPYHYPHTTEVAGCAVVSGGDERWLNNMFAPQPVKPTVGEYGLSAYSDCPMSMHEYLERQRAMWADPSQGGGERNPLQSLYAGGNIYLSGAQGLNKQEGAADDSERMQEDAPFFGGTVSTSVACDEPMPVTLVEEPDGLYLQCTVPQAVADTRMQVVTSDMLGVPRIVEERYEQPGGSDYVLDTDLLGQALTATERKAGALNGLVSGENRIRIWEWNN